MDFLYKFFILYCPLLFSLCVHEWAHGFIAKKKGDLTAEMEGRLTLNPIAHADILGTVILPLVAIAMNFPVFGWAKPVPVQTEFLKNPKKDMFWIALAGPLSNFILAIAGGFLFFVFYALSFPKEFFMIGESFIYINLLLGFFNLIPLHPLDGGKVISRFLTVRGRQFLENMQGYSSYILIALFILGGFQYIALPAYWLTQVLTRFPMIIF